jgi:hypothetical protein
LLPFDEKFYQKLHSVPLQSTSRSDPGEIPT